MIKTLHSILLNKYMTRESMKNLYNMMIEPTTIYVSEAWIMNSNTI